MAQVSDHIAKLTGGITQQPPETRIKEATETMVNAYPSAIQGLSKRRGAEFVSSLTSTALGSTSFMHTIDRDEFEKYFAIVNGDGTVEVYDLNGVAQSVAMDPNSITYLSSSDPSTNIRAVTTGDYTFLSNKSVTADIATELEATNEANTHSITLDLMDREVNSVPFNNDSVYSATVVFAKDVTLSTGATETVKFYPLANPDAFSLRYYRKADRSSLYNISGQVITSDRWANGIPAPQNRDTAYRRGLYIVNDGDIQTGVGDYPNVTGTWINLDNTDPAWAWAESQVSGGFTETNDTKTVSKGFKVLRSTNSDLNYSSEAVTHVAIQLRDGQSSGSSDAVNGHSMRFSDIFAQRLSAEVLTATDTEGNVHTLTFSATSNAVGEVSITTNLACYISSAYEVFNGSTYTVGSAFTGTTAGNTQSIYPQNTANPSGYRLEVIVGHDRVLSTGAIERFYKKYSGTQISATSTSSANIVYQLQGAGGSNQFTGTDIEGGSFTVDLSSTSYDENTGEIQISSGSEFFIFGVNEFLDNRPISDSPTFSGRKVTDFEDLPDKGAVGEIVQVTGQRDTEEDDYFVTYEDGRWTETLAPDAQEDLDSHKMPQVLIRNNDGNWSVVPHNWQGRSVGSRVSNETPSFVGKQIADVFLFQGRLGICAGESIVLSEVDYFEQFYRSTCIQLEDDNRIDVELRFGRVEKPHAALAVQDELILFSDKGQFSLNSNQQALTPKTVSAKQIGDYETSTQVRPYTIGKSAFFTAEIGGYTQAREFYLGAATDDRLLSSELTIQCPQYVTGNARYIQASRDHKILFVLNRDDPTSLFVYKFEYDGQDKVQSAWCRWDLGVGDIESIGLFQNYLYLVSSLGDERELTRIDIRDQPDLFGSELLRLDMQVVPTTTYYPNGVDGQSDAETRLDIPFDGTDLVEVWDLSGGYSVPVDRYTASGNLFVKGDYSAATLVVGISYEMAVKLSTIYMKAPRKPAGEILVTDGRLTINYLNIAFTDTATFSVDVSSRARATKTYHAGPRAGYTTSTFGTLPKSSGALRVPVMTRNDNAEITLKNVSPFGCTILHVDWFGKHNPHARRV